MIGRNPEFMRNVWLELTSHRLVGMPAVLGALFFFAHMIGNAAAVASTAFGAYLALTVLWGARLASEAVVGEVRDRTWDIQRLSSIGPWPMTWGKLLGSTIYPWYGALMCLLVYALMHELGLLLGLGLLAQAVALLSSLQGIRKNLTQGRSASAAYLVLGLIAAAVVWRLASPQHLGVHWYGRDYVPANFVLASLYVFLAWSVIAIYRQLRGELQLRTTPLVWMAFVLFLAWYLSGFVTLPGGASRVTTVRLFGAYSLVLASTYLMAFIERKDGIAFRRLFYYMDRRSWWRVLEEMPCWFVSLVMVAVFGLILALRDYSDFSFGAHRINPDVYLLATFLFLLRDLALILYFNLGRKPGRADAAALLYLALLYVLIPGILSRLGLDMAVAALLPWKAGHGSVTIVAALAQAAAMMALLVGRWRANYWVGTPAAGAPPSRS